MTMHPTGRRLARRALIAALAALAPAALAAQDCTIHDTLPPDYAALERADVHPPLVEAAPRRFVDPTAAFHGQILLGGDLLYHLPMFMTDPGGHPHNFQVVLRVELPPDLAEALRADREDHPEALYTAMPPEFSQLGFVGYPGHPPQAGFGEVRLVRNHFERPETGPELVGAGPLAITEVVHFRQLAPGADRPDGLAYLIAPAETGPVAVHLLSANPDFDHLARLSVEGALPEAPVYVTLAGRPNTPENRLAPGETLTCTGAGGDLSIEVAAEVYCEIGELANIAGQGPFRQESCAPL